MLDKAVTLAYVKNSVRNARKDEYYNLSTLLIASALLDSDSLFIDAYEKFKGIFGQVYRQNTGETRKNSSLDLWLMSRALFSAHLLNLDSTKEIILNNVMDLLYKNEGLQDVFIAWSYSYVLPCIKKQVKLSEQLNNKLFFLTKDLLKSNTIECTDKAWVLVMAIWTSAQIDDKKMYEHYKSLFYGISESKNLVECLNNIKEKDFKLWAGSLLYEAAIKTDDQANINHLQKLTDSSLSDQLDMDKVLSSLVLSGLPKVIQVEKIFSNAETFLKI